MPDLELDVTPEQVQATLSFACPKCALEVSATVMNDSLVKPTCLSCGWSASFSLKVSF